jgi:hypothetical protein
MTAYYIEDVSELTEPELAQMARELREHHNGRTDPKLLAFVSDRTLVQSTLKGRAWLRRSIAEAEGCQKPSRSFVRA